MAINFEYKIFYICMFSDAPVCAAQSVTIVGASLEESVGVHCRVNADPPDVEFEWIFSNSGERIESSHGQYNIESDVTNGFVGECASDRWTKWSFDKEVLICLPKKDRVREKEREREIGKTGSVQTRSSMWINARRCGNISPI